MSEVELQRLSKSLEKAENAARIRLFGKAASQFNNLIKVAESVQPDLQEGFRFLSMLYTVNHDISQNKDPIVTGTLRELNNIAPSISNQSLTMALPGGVFGEFYTDRVFSETRGLLMMSQGVRDKDIGVLEHAINHFLQKGFTEGQAKVKLVLEDERISSACTGRGNIADLSANVAVALDKTKLTEADIGTFKKYAAATCSGYCAGCAHICERALPDAPYVSEIMRYLMYYNSYGEQQQARELFTKIPGCVRDKLQSIDYSVAEACCPQHLPIGKLVAEAVGKLA